MADIDPYATLGVARTTTQREIAGAYRRLAKQWHPDAATTPEDEAARVAAMARINNAWHVLSNPARRARWDATHPVGGLPHWGAPMATAGSAAASATTWSPPVSPSPMRTRSGPTTVRDSGWLALGVIAVVAFLVGGTMILLTAGNTQAYPWGDEAATFSGGGIEFSYPPDWTTFPGRDDVSGSHAVVVHVVSDATVAAAAEPCTIFDQMCGVTLDTVPRGELSVIVTSWRGGTPPVPEPIRRLTYGLHGRMIGDMPVAHDLDRRGNGVIAWWQLSAPDFPERWFEVHASIAGGDEVQAEAIATIEAVLETLRFTR